MLTRLSEAFRQVHAGQAKYKLIDGRREYQFEGFTLIMAND
jgi:hypothetical protein